MDDMKDKVKGFMKKVNNPFTSSSSGKFKGQGRTLGSSAPSSSAPTSSIPSRIIPPPVIDSTKSKISSSSSNSRPNVNGSSNLSDKKIENKKSEIRTHTNENGKVRNGFDPFDSLITSTKRNPNGYELNVVECPVCGKGYGSEEEVAGHIENCLKASEVKSECLGKEFDDGDGREEAKGELEVCVGAYVSGKPSEGSMDVVLKLLKNVVREPENGKFRKIRMGNPKIKEAIGDVVGAVELLECVGFNLNEDGEEMWAVMDVPSKEQLGLIQGAISLLEPQKVEESPSTAPAKVDEPDDPKEIDRQIRVFFSVPESTAAKIELPDSFYNLSREELKREADMRKKKIGESQLLIPRSFMEKQAKAARKRFTKTVIRVQFPDGVVLQGIFLPSEPTTALYEFVSSALKEQSLEFELLDPVLVKRRVIPRFPAAGQRAITLEVEELVPSALIKFRPIETDSVVFTGLRNELLEVSEPLVPGSAVA
ncbi:plant UBX domain-containing protein 2 isoform X2 [Coffea arabica]|uniref:Plant UBX domain-containing protein 2 isoform X2 n=1 Tax=Coffea arabica TaxID=13443 RepID=A0A6P6VCP1_COFAR|nr:plant UBX domain-containing protein 2-like [Coffea arabica]